MYCNYLLLLSNPASCASSSQECHLMNPFFLFLLNLIPSVDFIATLSYFTFLYCELNIFMRASNILDGILMQMTFKLCQ